MSTRILFIAFFFLTLYAKAQLIVGIPDRAVIKGKEIDARTMRAFEKTTTVFFYNERDAGHFEKYGEEIKKNWTVTKLIFAPVEEAKNYAEYGKYSFLTMDIQTSVKTMESGKTVVSALRIYLDLSVPVGGDKYTDIARLVVGLHIKDLAYIVKNYFNDLSIRQEWWGSPDLANSSYQDIDLSNTYLYSKANFTNYYPGTLKFYLGEINNRLLKNETSSVLEKVENPEKLAALAEKTLIVPAEMLDEYKAFKGKVVRKDPEKFFKDYDYKYEIKSTAQINEMLLKDEFPKDAYLLIPAISNTDKYISIYSAEGEKIYKNFDAFDKEFSSGDLKKINKAITKAAK